MCFYCFRLLFSVVVGAREGLGWADRPNEPDEPNEPNGADSLMGLIGLACLLIQKLLTPNSFYILYMLSPMVAGGSFQFWWELMV